MLITVFASALCVFIMRYIPFILWADRDIPKTVRRLGILLPPALMATLVVYCLRNTNISDVSSLLPALSGVIATAAVHILKKNTILSIAAGTVLYMLMLKLF